MSDLTTRVESLEGTSSKHSDSLQNHNERITSLEEKVDNINSKIAKLRNQIAALAAGEKGDGESTMIQMGGVPEEFEEKLNDLASKLAKHMEDYARNKDSTDSRIDQTEKDIKDILSQLKALESNLTN